MKFILFSVIGLVSGLVSAAPNRELYDPECREIKVLCRTFENARNCDMIDVCLDYNYDLAVSMIRQVTSTVRPKFNPQQFPKHGNTYRFFTPFDL